MVSTFALDVGAVLTYGGALKKVAARFRGEASMVNLPHRAPPALPRLIVKLEGALLQLGLDRFQIVMEPPSHVSSSYADAMGFARDRFVPLLVELAATPQHEHSWSGVVFDIAFPVAGAATGSAAVESVFRRLVTLKWDCSQLASFTLNVGRRSGGFFRNYTVSGYERRKFEIPASELARGVSIETDAGSIEETGVNLLLDVNSKPTQDGCSALDDLERTLKEHTDAYSDIGEDLNLTGVL